MRLAVAVSNELNIKWKLAKFPLDKHLKFNFFNFRLINDFIYFRLLLQIAFIYFMENFKSLHAL